MMLLQRLRSWLRRHERLHRAASSVARRATGPYEARFEAALLKAFEEADCFWDVGANVGEYVVKAAGRVSKVVAVEPSAACCVALRRLSGSPLVVEAALSDNDGHARLSVDAGPIAVSNRLVSGEDESGVDVRTVRGDSLVAQGVPVPNVMKVDVEGFEGEVLDGMPLLLRSPSLRTVCMEVHFSQLHDRGRDEEPARIVRLLREVGFRVRWVDPSHLVATRRY